MILYNDEGYRIGQLDSEPNPSEIPLPLGTEEHLTGNPVDDAQVESFYAIQEELEIVERIVAGQLRRNLRNQVLKAYGGKCTKCGNTDRRCLQVDRITYTAEALGIWLKLKCWDSIL